MTDGATPRFRILDWPAAVVLLLLHFVLLFSSVADKSLTFDEPIQLTGGHLALTQGDYRVSPQSGLLPQLLCAVPSALGGAQFDSASNPTAFREMKKVELAKEFVFRSGNDVSSLVRNGRAMIMLLGLGLGVAVFLWSRRLFGPTAGVFSLALYVLSPTMLAHGRLMTADIAGALFFLLGTWGVWSVLQEVTPRTVILGALAVAGMFLAKMSAPTLVLVAIVLLVVRLLSGRPLPVRIGAARDVAGVVQQLGVFALLLLLFALVAVFFVWAFHGFRFAAVPASAGAGLRMEHDWEYLQNSSGLVAWALAWLRDLHLLPDPYLFGLADTFKHAGQRFAFAAGGYSKEGWWWFFPSRSW